MGKKVKQSTIKYYLYYWIPPIVWAIIIFGFSANPTGKVGSSYLLDFAVKKIVHIVEYAIFTLLIYRGLIKSEFDKKNSGYWSIFMAFIYGLSDEFHQSFTPGREPTIRDVIFDTLGGSLAIYFIWNILPKLSRFKFIKIILGFIYGDKKKSLSGSK